MALYCPLCETKNKNNAKCCCNCKVPFITKAPVKPVEKEENIENSLGYILENTNTWAILGFTLSIVSNIFCKGNLNFSAVVFNVIGAFLSMKKNEKGFELSIAGLIIVAIFSIIWFLLKLISNYYTVFSIH